MNEPKPISLLQGLGWAVIAALSMIGANELHFPALTVLFVFGLLRVTAVQTTRKAFYVAIAAGMLLYSVEVFFFFNIFKWPAMVLWLILSFWLAIFVLFARRIIEKHSEKWYLPPVLAVIWCGLEFVRSEWYYFKFSWISIGFAFTPSNPFSHYLGVYGMGFMVAMLASFAFCANNRKKQILTLLVAGTFLAAIPFIGTSKAEPEGKKLIITGIQFEFPEKNELLLSLKRALQVHPDTDLFVLSEYTFLDPVPTEVLTWCKTSKKHLIAGGMQPTNNTFFNTAYVVGPEGTILFSQVKSVPIQLFKDGLPATQQALWESPWGPIGICVCYDLSYRRVVDRLALLGATALIVPTMDVEHWGLKQHQLHAKVGLMRRSELGIPVVRVCSSGISQIIEGNGTLVAKGEYPGQGDVVHGSITLGRAASVPVDHWLAPACVLLLCMELLYFVFQSAKSKFTRPNKTA